MKHRLHLELIDQAIGFATQAHDGHRRKAGNIPYIVHPIGVAMLLQSLNYSPNIIVASLLHDTVEDTPISLADIQQQFGSEITDIVAGCTEIKGSWEERKMHSIQKLRTASLEIKVVVAADKYHNLTHLRQDRNSVGPQVWERFKKGPEQQAWYYREMAKSLLANVPNPEEHPLFIQLQVEIEEVFAGIPSVGPTVNT